MVDGMEMSASLGARTDTNTKTSFTTYTTADALQQHCASMTQLVAICMWPSLHSHRCWNP